jgi:cellulose synthase/poly-beta-1,6-N-acetylglucosamine synthase-like glycosyltransferase
VSIIVESRVQNNKQPTAQHRAAVLRRDRFRQRLEQVLGWRSSAYYQHLRVYYRRWRHVFAPALALWKTWFWLDPYIMWIREQARRERFSSRAAVAVLPTHPRISVFLTVQVAYLPWLEQSIASLVAQSYPVWELWLCHTENSLSVRAVLERYANQDRRIQRV